MVLSVPWQCYSLLIIQVGLIRVAAILPGSSSDIRLRQRPLARRETPLDALDVDRAEMVEMESDYVRDQQAEAAVAAGDSHLSRESFPTQEMASYLDKSDEPCPPTKADGTVVNCGMEANNLNFHQQCWDCYPNDYQVLYCEKNSLSTTFVDICATNSKYRGAYCKEFYDEFHNECFFPGSEYKQIYCESVKMHGDFNPTCASDDEVGPNYCEGFALKAECANHETGHRNCNSCFHHPGFMMLFCQTKQNASTWDVDCANHNEVGANYCEDFALEGDLLADCVQYESYLALFCDVKATKNVTVPTCASNPSTSGMYCQEMALQKNGVEGCWGISEFDETYCAEIDWPNSQCEQKSASQSASR
jgi:hypothetical protein